MRTYILPRHRLAIPLAVALLAACGGEEFAAPPPEDEPLPPADVAGEYSIAVTNREDGCGFEGWEPGATTQNLPFSIAQDGAEVTGTIGGVAGQLVSLWLGSATFEGSVDEAAVTMTIYGTQSVMQGGCAYTINATVEATASGDLLEGTIRYVPETNGSPDCGVLDACQTLQDFNGTRPPT